MITDLARSEGSDKARTSVIIAALASDVLGLTSLTGRRISAPYSATNNSMTSRWPFKMARCSGERP